MTSGDEDMETVRTWQKFTGHLKCEGADTYDGAEPPTCLPLCEACLLKWLEKGAPHDR